MDPWVTISIAVLGALSGAVASVVPRLFERRKARADAAGVLVGSAMSMVVTVQAQLDAEVAVRRGLEARVDALELELLARDGKIAELTAELCSLRTAVGEHGTLSDLEKRIDAQDIDWRRAVSKRDLEIEKLRHVVELME